MSILLRHNKSLDGILCFVFPKAKNFLFLKFTFPYCISKPNSETILPPAALRILWPAAISHSIVGEVRG